jgi:hypothetical protein
MPAYSLHLEGHGEPAIYVQSHDFPSAMKPGDKFAFKGWTWQVVEVAAKQFGAAGEPDKTLRCIAV